MPYYTILYHVRPAPILYTTKIEMKKWIGFRSCPSILHTKLSWGESDFGRRDANNEHFWSRPPPPRRAPQTGLQGGELGGGRHIEGWAGPANCGILIRNPLPLNSKPISCTQAIYFGRVIHGTNLTHFDADIQSLIWFASTEICN